MSKLPNSPDDMPRELWNNSNWLRNLIMTLRVYDCVDIHFERDHAASDAAGESVGEWDVLIEDGRNRAEAKHEHILNALWFASECISDASQKAYEERQAAKAAALSKLTPDEKRLLGF